jgi:cell division protein FtsB
VKAGFLFNKEMPNFLRYDMHMPGFKGFKAQWIFVILIAILFIMVMGLNSRLSEYFQLTGQRKEMQNRIKNLDATQVALQTQIAYSGSDKAVEEWARTYERMVQPGDQVIIPLPPKDVTPEINYLATPEPENNENWQIWWDLFFSD